MHFYFVNLVMWIENIGTQDWEQKKKLSNSLSEFFKSGKLFSKESIQDGNEMCLDALLC